MNRGELEMWDEEFIHFYVEEVRLELDREDDRQDRGLGELFITSQYPPPRRLHFRTPALSLDLPYAQVAMHGLSSDPANFGAPCVLVQLVSNEDEQATKWLLKPGDVTQGKT